MAADFDKEIFFAKGILILVDELFGGLELVF
jgi:hypothetical protein